eukprot:COSAG05_NODE_13906_length_414_cov_1.434921_1_plen_66_part_01
MEYRPAAPGSAWPVVISAPHGGDLAPDAMLDRTSGCAEPDWQSWELAVAVWDAFAARSGRDANSEQ